MCTQFTCVSCRGTFADHCKDKPTESIPVTSTATTAEPVETNDQPVEDAYTSAAKALAATLPNQASICPGLVHLTTPKKCETCIRIRGAINKLENLIYQFPFLATDGMPGIEKLPQWERQETRKALCERKKSWDDKAESRDERHKLQEKIVSMGLEGVRDERKEHQGFAMDVTPINEKEESAVAVWE